MEVKVHSRVKMDPSFVEELQEKFSRLEKLIPGKGRAELFVKQEGSQYISEITFYGKHTEIFLKTKSHRLTESLDTLLDKAKTKLIRVHDKIIDKSHR